MNNDKVILVTGSSRGIGEGIITHFSKIGFNVVINYSKFDKEAKELYNKLINLSSKDKVLLEKTNVSNREEVKRMFDNIIDKFGKIDILINNAGINIDKPFFDMNDNDWEKVISTNLTGTFICSQEFYFHFKGEEGHIINISAHTGITGRKNGANYCSSKAGINTLTKCLALELAPKIKVNTVMPAFIDTKEVLIRYNLGIKENYENMIDSIPLKRLGNNDDIIKVINFIINESSFITGQSFYVNGGLYMS